MLLFERQLVLLREKEDIGMAVNYGELAKKNRKEAFIRYVRDWKKQDASTVEIHGDTYSYKTKRGVVKSFRATSEVTPLKVWGFYFQAL